MDLDDDTIARIGAAIQSLRERDQLHGHSESPLRLYRTRRGEFVRVLDDDTAPLTPEMLQAIEAYTANGKSDASDETVQEAPSAPSNGRNPCDSPHSSPSTTELSVRDHQERSESSSAVISYPMQLDEEESVAMEDVTEASEPTATTVQEETPSGLSAAGLSVGAWLNGDSTGEQGSNITDDMSGNVSLPAQASSGPIVISEPIETLMLQWPREVRERTRVCCGATQEHTSHPRRVVYWLRNTLRVEHGNFSLAAALQLGDHYKLPVVVFYLAPPSIMYPVRHASGINDALTRWSIAEVRGRMRDDYNIEMFAFTPQDGWRNTDSSRSATTLDGGSGLYTLLDAFHPAAVIIDDGFSLTSRGEVDCLLQFLQTRVRASWPLLAVDSTTCVPLQSLSEAVQKSLTTDTAPFLTEEEFANEYTLLLQQRDYFSTPHNQSRSIPSHQSMIRRAIYVDLDAAMKKTQVEELVWDIIEGMNAEAAKSIGAASERVALERLAGLVTAIDDRPAIQQELQGSGILSLVPFVRHGSVFSGYVLDKLAAAIASMPRPTDAKSRKAFATLKVLRSRASSHLARDRDYRLYLSLWAARQVERGNQLSGRVIPFRALSSFKPSVSELGAYNHVLPTWISPNKNLGGASCQTPVYDPYQLESGRTDDQYWNEIQLFLIEHRYVHPLVMVYWAYKIFQWSLSTRAGVATIEGLLDKCSLGSNHSPDAFFSIWSSLFRVGKAATDGTESAFVERVEAELSAQPRLQFRKLGTDMATFSG